MSTLSRRVLLAFPATLTATVISDSRIDIAWSSVLNAASYRIYRNGVLQGSQSALTASATGLTGSTQYLFQISCVDENGEEGPKCPTVPGTTFATPDTVAPTTPVISAGSATLSSVSVSLITPSVDTGSGIASYTLQRANNSTFTSNLVTTNGLTSASFPLLVSSLLSGTQYFFRLRAVDSAGNVGQFSATVSITTTAIQNPSVPVVFPNWPIMNGVCTQSSPPASADPSLAADKDVFIFQPIGYPTFAKCDTRVPVLQNIRAQQDTTKIQTRFFEYHTPTETAKVATSGGEKQFSYELINDPVNGHTDWYVRRVDGTPVEPGFSPETDYQVNVTTVAPRNSLNEDFATAYWKAHRNARTQAYNDLLAGVFHDVFNQVPPPITVNSGATSVTDPDYDRNGVADLRTDYGANGGGTRWALGNLNTIDRYKSRNPGKFVIVNGARIDSDVVSGLPPMPFSSMPMYRKLDMLFDEIVHANLLFSANSDGTWQFAGTSSSLARPQIFFRSYHVSEQFLKLDQDVDIELGHAVYWFHTAAIARTPTAADIAAHRFMSLCCLLVDRGGIMVNQASSQVSSLDETLINLGGPLQSRSMGTFTDPNDPTSFAIRTADFSSGVARFYWAEFQNAIVVVRMDSPTTGVYPSADAAVSCTLPSAGSGKKWQRFNAATYVNTRTNRATRGQDTTLNSGADVGSSISLKPWHAQILLRVPS